MKRDIQSFPAIMEAVATNDLDSDGVTAWLTAQAQAHGLIWLLAHAGDGVLWGRLDGDQLRTSHDVAPEVAPPLRADTLQAARLFAPQGELLLWRNGDNAWQARLIRDVKEGEEATWAEGFEEAQILWGTHGEGLPKGFTCMTDGQEGLAHVVPLEATGDYEDRPLRLHVRHYLTEDEAGFTRVVASRLVNLTVKGGKS